MLMRSCIAIAVAAIFLTAPVAARAQDDRTGYASDDPAIRPMLHIFVGSKAPWHEIADALPQYPGFPPAQALGM